MENSTKSKKPITKKWWFWVLSPFALFFVIVIIVGIFSPQQNTQNKNTIPTNTKNKDTNKIISQTNKTNQTKEIDPNLKSLQDSLNDAIKLIDQGIKFDKYYYSSATFYKPLAVFSNWGILISKGKACNNKDLQNLANILSDKVIKLQKNEFPKMRQAFADLLKLMYKNYQVDVDISLPFFNNLDNKILKIIHPGLIDEANIKALHEQFLDPFNKLRFKKIIYNFKKDEYTKDNNLKGASKEININTPNDDEIIIYNENELSNFSKEPGDDQITIENFNNLRQGMSLNQVRDLLKTDGVCEFSKKEGKNLIETYSFPCGFLKERIIYYKFVNKKLSGKPTQIGL